MQNAPQSAKKSVSADWLVRGVLTKIGDIVDRMTGRRYKPSSSLATSELIERMKFLMDSEALTEDGRTFIPHNIKLKMQWDKFSTDSEESLRALEYEFLTAAVDHVNDKRYYTKAPFHVEAKPDYFTSGVKLFVSFDKFVDDEREAGITVAVPGETPHPIPEAPVAEPAVRPIVVQYTFGGNPFQKELRVKERQRLSVGRTKENDLSIDDPSISKYHASLMLDAQGILHVADTGSTNGTFVNGERIAYGKAVAVSERDKVRFGLVEAQFQIPPKAVVTEVLPEAVPELPKTESYSVGEFQFTKRMETIAPATTIAASIAKVADDVEPRPKVPQPTNNSESVAPQPQITSDSIAAKLNDEDDIEIP